MRIKMATMPDYTSAPQDVSYATGTHARIHISHLASTLSFENATNVQAGVSCSRISAAHLIRPSSSLPKAAVSKSET